MVGYEPVSCV